MPFKDCKLKRHQESTVSQLEQPQLRISTAQKAEGQQCENNGNIHSLLVISKELSYSRRDFGRFSQK